MFKARAAVHVEIDQHSSFAYLLHARSPFLEDRPQDAVDVHRSKGNLTEQLRCGVKDVSASMPDA